MSVQADLVARRDELNKARENILDQLYDACQVMQNVMGDASSSEQLKLFYINIMDEYDEKLLILEEALEPILKLLNFTFTLESQNYIFAPNTFTMNGMDVDVPHDITFTASSKFGLIETEKVFVAYVCGREITFEYDGEKYAETARTGKFISPIADGVVNMDYDGEREDVKMTKAEFEDELAKGRSIFDGVTFTESLSLFKASGAYTLKFKNCAFADFDKAFQFQRSLQDLSFENCTIEGESTFAAFAHCHNLIYLDVTGLDTSKVKNMEAMFLGCDRLTSLDVNNLDTSNVTDMCSMFGSCFRLINLNLTKFKFTKVNDLQTMFRSCINLERIYTGNLVNLSHVTNSTLMFHKCKKLEGINGTKYNADHVDSKYARIDKEGEPGYFSYLLM